MQAIPAIFALLVAAAGWFYLFYSRAAVRLAAFENARLNRLRIHLRRIGAVAMILLAIAFAVGYYGVDQTRPTRAFEIAWSAVLVLMLIILGVGMIDLRLTQKMRRDRARQLQQEDNVP